MRKITTEEINRFELEARKVGVGLVIAPRSEMEKNGYYNGLPVASLIDGIETSIPVIILPDAIDIEKFKSTQSGCELDRTRIPEHLIYDFLIHHECAHARYGHPEVMRHRERFNNLPAGSMECICEIQADRYAWYKIQPGVAMPIVTSRKSSVKKFDAFIRRHKATFKAFESKMKAIPADACVVIMGLK